MKNETRIGDVARMTGISAKTIRFYEDEGLVPRPGRSDSGYRLYTDADLTRLRIIRGARILGLGLPQIRTLLDKALGESCAAFGAELQDVLSTQLAQVEQRIAELTALRDDLLRLQNHVTHCCEECPPDQDASDCDFCGLSTQPKGGAPNA